MGKRVWNGCVSLIGEYARLWCLGCSGLLHSGLALDHTDCCHYGKWVWGGKQTKAFMRKHAQASMRKRVLPPTAPSQDPRVPCDVVCIQTADSKIIFHADDCFVYSRTTKHRGLCFCWRKIISGHLTLRLNPKCALCFWRMCHLSKLEWGCIWVYRQNGNEAACNLCRVSCDVTANQLTGVSNETQYSRCILKIKRRPSIKLKVHLATKGSSSRVTLWSWGQMSPGSARQYLR